MAYESKRQRYYKLIQQLKLERLTWEPAWRDIADNIMPNRLRFFISEMNKGDRRNQKILNSAPVSAARVLTSGLMAGITSPSRPWFRLSVPDPNLAEVGSVKQWLDDVTERMRSVFIKCGIYNSLPEMYGDVGAFGTSAMLIEEDFDNVIRTYTFPLGSYWIALDDKLRVTVFYREFKMTVRQILQKFQAKENDWSNISSRVKSLHDSGNLEGEISVCHLIHPNPDYKEGSMGQSGKKFASCYFENGQTGTTSNTDYSGGFSAEDQEKYLRESGYDLFPVLVTRWKTTGEDTYGTDCPGMESIGDCKQLQVMEKKSLQIIALHAQPPLKAPSAMQKQVIALIPGQVSYVDEVQGASGQKVEPLYQIPNPALDKLEGKINGCINRIDDSFFVNLFLMLANDERTQPPTAEEIVERRSEKMIALGPALERFNKDLLDPLIDIVFDFGLKQGIWPIPPEELQGTDLRVEYISIMAQAQKMTGLTGNDRLIGMVGRVVEATQDPSKSDIIDFDELMRDSAESLGTSPKVVRTKEMMAEREMAKQQAAQAQAKIAAAEQAAGAAQKLAASDMSGDNALTRLTEQGAAGALAGMAG